MRLPFAGVFRSLRGFNYRVWAAGAFVSNIGTWVQRTGQDWLVFTQLTDHDASAVGLVMALQFGPQLLLLPWTGVAADHFDQRKLLIATQATMGSLALILGLLTVTGAVELWHVYIFAFLFGSAAAFDAPVRQTFVAELVGDADLHNAVALNSTSFNAARMIGPAIAGLTIAAVGTGWAFLINGASFAAVLVSLACLRIAQLRPNARAHRVRAASSKGSAMCGSARTSWRCWSCCSWSGPSASISRSSSRPWRSASFMSMRAGSACCRPAWRSAPSRAPCGAPAATSRGSPCC